jgi:hypothetical protein
MKVQIRMSILLSVVALVAALGGVAGAGAAGVLIGSKQIKNGTVKSIDLRNNGVQSADLTNGGVSSADLQDNGVSSPDLAPGSVEGEAIDVAGPVQCQVAGAVTIVPTLEFQKVTDLCTYTKVEGVTPLEVDWTGSVEGRNGGEAGGCTFQLRANDVPSAQGGGETFGKGLSPANAAAIFAGIPAGPVTVSVWAKISIDSPIGNSCTVGPEAAGIVQTVTVAEAIT